MKEDYIDRMLAQANIPRTDVSTIEVVGRLHRAVSFINDYLEDTFAKLNLKQGEVEVLLALAMGDDEPKSPTRVASQLLCSSGAMTNRLDRLEKAGLITRRHDTNDRRAILLAITSEGRKAAKRAAAARDALDAKLIPELTSAERKTLTGLLRKMLIAHETAASM